MRSFSALVALVISALAVVGSAHESVPGAHRRMLARSRHAQRDGSALAALSLINETISGAEGQVSVGKNIAGGLAAGAKPSVSASASSASPTGTAASAAPTSTGSSSGLQFPELGFQMPSQVPDSLDGWWADPSTEYAFLGFSYEVSNCQSQEQLTKDFKNIREKFNGRYVRLYGACVENDNQMVTKSGYYDTIVEAAWEAGIGIHALIWFGFNGGTLWENQRDTLFDSIQNNPKAKFVTRVVQFGSEPLFDDVLPAKTLASQVTAYKKKLAPYGINVTVSELVYGFEKISSSDRQTLFDAMDDVHLHELPFFSTKATTGSAALPLVKADIQWLMKNAPGKKIYMDENGWPSTTYSGVEANSKSAVASVADEQQYFDLLDNNCEYFKDTNGGIGWFYHIYSDDQEPGYGLYNDDGKLKFSFSPKTSC